MSRRRLRRSIGKRRLRREAHRDVVRIIELYEAGYLPSVIASAVGLPLPFVQEVLGRADEVREAVGGGA